MTFKGWTHRNLTMAASRKHNPSIPAHIDQKALPKGVYWDGTGNGRWYVFVDKEGKRGRKTIAGPDARLSELHAMVEEPRGAVRGTIAWLCEGYHASPWFSELAVTTKRDYEYCRDVTLGLATNIGKPFGQLEAQRVATHHIQRLVDRLRADGTPTKANKFLRYIRLVFRWGVDYGMVPKNPAHGVRAAKEHPRQREVSHTTYNALLDFAQERGARPARSVGSVAPYLWLVMELSYLCRLRGIETITLTEANATTDGIRTNRRKGSRDNVVAWTPRLRAAWDAALTQRQAVLARTKRPEFLVPAQRALFLAEGGEPLSKSGLDTAWQRMVRAAIDAGVIAADDRFSLHDLKRKGGTDTPGTRAEKQDALGVTEAMMDIYDKSLPYVRPSA